MHREDMVPHDDSARMQGEAVTQRRDERGHRAGQPDQGFGLRRARLADFDGQRRPRVTRYPAPSEYTMPNAPVCRVRVAVPDAVLTVTESGEGAGTGRRR